MKQFKSRFFRVATEGATTDGRAIQRVWIEQMARNFNIKKYGARVWLEHIRGILPDGEFRAYGDVDALEAREVENGKLALFAQIDPTTDLLALNKKRQKIYTSAEIDPDFAKSGEAYLVGLGITDSPASLGTDVLAFAAQKPESSPFASRKTSPATLFSVAEESLLEFDEIDTAAASRDTATPGLIAGVRELLARLGGPPQAEKPKPTLPPPAATDLADLAAHVATFAEQYQLNHKAMQKQLDDIASARRADRESFDTLSRQLDHTANGQPKRPLATGGSGAEQTDC